MLLFKPFCVGSVQVDPRRLQVEVGGEIRTVEPLAMRLLLCLVEAQGNVVTREELISTAWSGEYIGDGSLSRAIWSLRQVLGDDASHPVYIETIPRVGYRLKAEVSFPEAGHPVDQDVNRLQQSVRRLRYALATLAAGFIVVVALWQLAPEPEIEYVKMLKVPRADGTVDTLSVRSETPIDMHTSLLDR